MVTRRLLCPILPLLLTACGSDTPTSIAREAVTVTPDVLTTSYAGCPADEVAFCAAFHLGSEPIAWCTYEGCFEMTAAEEVRVVAADEQGLFPRTFFVWTDHSLAPTALEGCVLTKKGHKTRVDLPDGGTRCAASLTTSEYVYFEHFASNPASGCLGWIECRVSRP